MGGSQKKHSPTAIGGLLKRVLPSEFAEQSAHISQFQAFFSSLSLDPVFQEVQVLKVEGSHITLALPSSALANYLRLYQQELLKVLRVQFNREFQLRIVVSPGGSGRADSRVPMQPAGRYSEQVCDRIRGTAKGIEDDELRQALMSLARRIQR